MDRLPESWVGFATFFYFSEEIENRGQGLFYHLQDIMFELSIRYTELVVYFSHSQTTFCILETTNE